MTGIGETGYRRGTDKSALRLTLEASLAAIADSGLTPKDIDGVIAYASGRGRGPAHELRERGLPLLGDDTDGGCERRGDATQCAAMAVADHQASRMVVDSFRLFDCCLESDGGASRLAGGLRVTVDYVN